MSTQVFGDTVRTAPSRSRPLYLGWILLGLGFISFLLVPLVLDDFYFLHIFILVFYFAYLGTAWSLVGMAGQMSIGHAAFLGMGGYISTLLFMDLGLTPWVGMWVGAITAAVVGVIIGYPTFRLRGPYFALTTIAMAEILRIYVENTEVGPFGIHLRGAMGLLVPPRGNDPAVFQFFGKEPYYYIALGMMCAAITISYVINRTRLGYYLVAIRSDRDAAESLGINLTKFNLIVMAISCFLTALGGTFYAQYFRYINPERGMGLTMSIEIVLVGVVGGWQTVLGPTIGSLLLSPTSEIIRGEFGGTYAGLHLLLYGLVLMIVILFLPKGLNDPIMEGLRTLQSKIWPPPKEPIIVAPQGSGLPSSDE
jgi:branched-chain amino acid transport system permease protein